MLAQETPCDPLSDSVASTTTSESEGEERGQGGPFGGLSASEAAKRRHELERARKAEPEPTSTEKIVQALRGKAERGDVPAARELREWLRLGLGEPEQGAQSIEDMTPEQRHKLKLRLLAGLDTEETPA